MPLIPLIFRGLAILGSIYTVYDAVETSTAINKQIDPSIDNTQTVVNTVRTPKMSGDLALWIARISGILLAIILALFIKNRRK